MIPKNLEDAQLNSMLSNIFETENVKIKNYRNSLELITNFIVFCSSIGVFAGFWNFYLHLRERNHNIKIRITYTSKNEETVEIELNKISESNYQEILGKYPPKNKQNVKLSTDQG